MVVWRSSTFWHGSLGMLSGRSTSGVCRVVPVAAATARPVNTVTLQLLVAIIVHTVCERD